MEDESKQGTFSNIFSGPSELSAAIVEAQRAVRSATKDSTNKYFQYKFTSGEQMIALGREALNSAGLALFVAGWDSIPPISEGHPSRLRIAYELTHKSGQSQVIIHTIPVLPEKGRPLDKAEAAALTFSLSYVLRGVLLVDRKTEDEEVDERNDTGYDPFVFVKEAEDAIRAVSDKTSYAVAKTALSRVTGPERARLVAELSAKLGAMNGQPTTAS